MRVRAEMLTLVAERMIPMNMASRTEKPNGRLTSAPDTSGKTTPRVPAKIATLRTLFTSFRSVSRPARNIRKMTPSSAIRNTVSFRWASAK